MIFKKKFLFIILFSLTATIFSEISFYTPEINDQSQILFSVTHKYPGELTYSTLFSADLDNPLTTLKQLTSFPEHLSLLSNGEILRIKNRYGISTYSIKTKTLNHIYSNVKNPLPAQPIFAGIEAVSPNGKWICSIKKTGHATGTVIIKNESGYTETELIPEVQLSNDYIPVLWAPDSSMLIYEKDGILYFTEPSAMFRSNQIPEHLRKIGKGSINSVFWVSNKTLIYISNDLIYSIPLFEMYTRALYSDFVGIGTIIGRLPFNFSPISDKFSVDKKSTEMIIIKNKRTIYHLQLPDNANYVKQLFTTTEDILPGQTINNNIFWDNNNIPILWFQINDFSETKTNVYRLIKKENISEKEILSVPENAIKPSISPDRKKIFFTTENQSFIYNTALWNEFASFKTNSIISCIWANNNTLYLGDSKFLRCWTDSDKNNTQILFPSSVSSYRWNPLTSNAVIQSNKLLYEYDNIENSWNISSLDKLPETKSKNNYYRTFLGTSPNCNFSNAPYVRNLTGPTTTKILYAPASTKKTHNAKVALYFDAIDNADGLATILQTLKKYSIKATFFINGEFLRRYPIETQLIQKYGHECGSMFYTVTDLVNTKDFIVDEDFIRRGLARNEDEFYDKTGAELALIWHTPFQQTNDSIINAGKNAGYTYINTKIESLDSITLEDAIEKDINYLSCTKIIENILTNLENKTLIPITVGISDGKRNDYLYDNLDLLIQSILEAGYDIVPIEQINK